MEKVKPSLGLTAATRTMCHEVTQEGLTLHGPEESEIQVRDVELYDGPQGIV